MKERAVLSCITNKWEPEHNGNQNLACVPILLYAMLPPLLVCACIVFFFFFALSWGKERDCRVWNCGVVQSKASHHTPTMRCCLLRLFCFSLIDIPMHRHLF
ncbi:hypothetical protein QOT17_013931 [Balamuthia mandrillaris]